MERRSDTVSKATGREAMANGSGAKPPECPKLPLGAHPLGTPPPRGDHSPGLRRWGEPAVAGPIISSLVIALFGVGVAAFQSLKDDIRASETRLVADLKDPRAELKADNRALSNTPDRVLENLRP